MKRNTLILLLTAILLGIAVYYLEYKPGKPRKDAETTDSSKPAWEIKQEEITSVELKRESESILLLNENGKWSIRQPIAVAVNEPAINALLGDLAGLRIEREFPSAGEDLKSYRLAPAAVRVEFKLKNGQTHLIEIGEKDVLGGAVYARIDNGSNVAMVTSSLLVNTDKSVNGFRDRRILGGTTTDLNSLRFRNESGSFGLEKKEAGWSIVSPSQEEVAEDEVSSFLSTVTTAEATEVVSETDAEAAKYGLASPKISVTVRLTSGAERTISIGSKVDDGFYGRISDRPQIFKVASSLETALNSKLSTFRSKAILKIDRENLSTIVIKNSKGTLTAEPGAGGKWLFKLPAERKGKEVSAFRIIDPFEAKATEIIEKPGADVVKALSKPVIEARLTTKAGKVTVIQVSSAVGTDAYVRIEGRSTVFKVPQSMIDTLDFDLDEITVGQ